MGYGEPKPVEGKCNARMHVGDNYGDNHATMMCELLPNHAGPHSEAWTSSGSGLVTVTWEREDPQIAIDALADEIEKAVYAAHPTAYSDIEWIEELETAATAFKLDERVVFYRIDDLQKIWISIGDVKEAREIPKAEAIQALIEGLNS